MPMMVAWFADIKKEESSSQMCTFHRNKIRGLLDQAYSVYPLIAFGLLIKPCYILQEGWIQNRSKEPSHHFSLCIDLALREANIYITADSTGVVKCGSDVFWKKAPARRRREHKKSSRGLYYEKTKQFIELQIDLSIVVTTYFDLGNLGKTEGFISK